MGSGHPELTRILTEYILRSDASRKVAPGGLRQDVYLLRDVYGFCWGVRQTAVAELEDVFFVPRKQLVNVVFAEVLVFRHQLDFTVGVVVGLDKPFVGYGMSQFLVE